MKKIVLTLVAVGALAASAFAQGTIAADNLNGTGASTATSFGLFFASNGTAYNGASINMVVLGGSSAGSLSPIATFTGGGAAINFGAGVFADPAGLTYPVPNVALGGTAVLQVLAWLGSANSYGTAAVSQQFWAYNGTTYVDASTFTFNNPTGGGGSPPGPPKSMDGMPAMRLQAVPEPTTVALAGLGIASLLIFRRKK